MNILFVCSANINRSKTAEDYFRFIQPRNEYKSAGTNHKSCNKHNTTCLTEDMLEWADIIYMMEQHHLDIINRHVNGLYDNKIEVLNIKDIYQYNDKELIKVLDDKINGSVV